MSILPLAFSELGVGAASLVLTLVHEAEVHVSQAEVLQVVLGINEGVVDAVVEGQFSSLVSDA